ncbi:hypothetical protein E2C01_084466 [Portunus trituberculatus]|uniref:Uncharacterized protein n=1 Tax=Portunus trituberculatus TaxID=210409 RepID=A0A5B7J433_PORTR|nr:hypothetical protein [Portunus trituberculatus]
MESKAEDDARAEVRSETTTEKLFSPSSQSFILFSPRSPPPPLDKVRHTTLVSEPQSCHRYRHHHHHHHGCLNVLSLSRSRFNMVATDGHCTTLDPLNPLYPPAIKSPSPPSAGREEAAICITASFIS